jgi:hypothetical protein
MGLLGSNKHTRQELSNIICFALRSCKNQLPLYLSSRLPTCTITQHDLLELCSATSCPVKGIFFAIMEVARTEVPTFATLIE